MNEHNPPHLLERSLLLLLPARDRETVVGDLHEAFCEEVAPQVGRFRANLWYARQVLSLVPRRLLSFPGQRAVLASICSFTALSGLWLGAMGLRLRHPGFGQGEIIAGILVLQALLTLFVLRFRQRRALRAIVFVGCAALIYLAGMALRGVLREGAHFEGYILLISLALLAQVALTCMTLLRTPAQPSPRP